MSSANILLEDRNEVNTEKTKANLIRKLGIIENYFHGEIEKGTSINASTILITSEIDIFEYKDLFNKAVKLWKQTQPFLRSKVVHLNENVNNENENYFPHNNKYFAFINDDEELDVNNVNYLYLKSDESVGSKYDDCGDYWKLLIERELTIPIDWENGPMWRLMLVNLKKTSNQQPPENNIFEYCLIVTVSHAIFDGTSAFVSLISLFSIFEALYMNKLDLNDIYDAKVIKPVENYATEYINRLEDKNNLADYVHLNGFKKPSDLIITKEADRTDYYPIQSYNEKTDYGKLKFYSAIDNKPLIGLDELLSISKSSITKFYFNTFEGDKYNKFLAKCKEKKAKVTGVFNTIFIIAWRLVYKKFVNQEDGDLLDQKINYLTIVNLRSFLKEIDIGSLVWFCNNLYSSFDHKFDTSDHDFWHEKFWNFARQESEMFHDRLKRGEQFKLLEASKPIDHDEVRIHYGLSNLLVPSQIAQIVKLIQLKDLFTLTSYRKDWSSDFSYNNIISVGDKMCWTLSYNSYFVKNETIDYFIQMVNEIYDKLCDI